jgi:hypothetical protein
LWVPQRVATSWRTPDGVPRREPRRTARPARMRQSRAATKPRAAEPSGSSRSGVDGGPGRGPAAGAARRSSRALCGTGPSPVVSCSRPRARWRRRQASVGFGKRAPGGRTPRSPGRPGEPCGSPDALRRDVERSTTSQVPAGLGGEVDPVRALRPRTGEGDPRRFISRQPAPIHGMHRLRAGCAAGRGRVSPEGSAARPETVQGLRPGGRGGRGRRGRKTGARRRLADAVAPRCSLVRGPGRASPEGAGAPQPRHGADLGPHRARAGATEAGDGRGPGRVGTAFRRRTDPADGRAHLPVHLPAPRGRGAQAPGTGGRLEADGRTPWMPAVRPSVRVLDRKPATWERAVARTSVRGAGHPGEQRTEVAASERECPIEVRPEVSQRDRSGQRACPFCVKESV